MPKVELELPPSLADFARALEEVGRVALEAHEELSSKQGAAVDYGAVERRVSRALEDLVGAVHAGCKQDERKSKPSSKGGPNDIHHHSAAGVSKKPSNIRSKTAGRR